MRAFDYVRAADPRQALAAAARPDRVARYLAGGTTLIDLMKLDVEGPARLVDVNALATRFGAVEATPKGLRLGALARMSEAEAHPEVRRDYPLIADSLRLAASPQLRNMASLGGNVLQRTRCAYFRDVSFAACNKRDPGSGCAALEGVNRRHAVLGVSEACIATYPGDLGQALTALDAEVEILGPAGPRMMAFEGLHRAPAATPHIETALAPGELITGFFVPAGPWTRRSLYLKVRDRASFDFALAAAAVALDLEDGVVRQARIALGGVATRPWRSRVAEARLAGRRLDQASAGAAAEAAFAGAVTHGGNDYKPELGRRTLVRALMAAQAMEV
ncbi:MAG TPA: xanthine dehydrogenase family protein subunit M [Caulobacteraceae bacterium]|nr:xanthine dehydrogenase family protein subunit M [Caulobacteraceae bacterium]